MDDGYMDAAAAPVPDAGDDTLREQLFDATWMPGLVLSEAQRLVLVGTLMTPIRDHVAAAVQAERDKHNEEFGGFTECGGEGVDCDTHPVTLVDHEGPVSCVWCALAANRGRAQTAEAAIERVRNVCAWVPYKVPGDSDSYGAYPEGRSDLAGEVLAALNGSDADA